MAKPYGQKITRGKGVAGSHFAPGKAVGKDSLGSAIGELNSQHPHEEHTEGLQHKKGQVNGVGRSKAVI